MKQAVICILRKGNKTLFVKRSEDKEFIPGLWALPSGMVGEGETLSECVKREFREEFGIKIKEPELLEKITEKEEGRGQIEKYIYLVEPRGSFENIQFDLVEADGAIFMIFEEFYSMFKDEEMGHILVYLRSKYNNLAL